MLYCSHQPIRANWKSIDSFRKRGIASFQWFRFGSCRLALHYPNAKSLVAVTSPLSYAMAHSIYSSILLTCTNLQFIYVYPNHKHLKKGFTLVLEKNMVQESFPCYLQANKHICPRGAHLHQNFTSFWNYLQFVHQYFFLLKVWFFNLLYIIISDYFACGGTCILLK